MPETDNTAWQAKLAQAEQWQWLNTAADHEIYEQSLLNHFLASQGLAVACDDKRPADGWIIFATGMIASEVKIYTSP